MDAKVSYGLDSILFADIAEDGGCGTDWEQWGYTNEGSATFETEDPDETDFNCEELDDPLETVSIQGKTTLEFEMLNPSLDVLVKALGGEIDEETGHWLAPTITPVIEKSVKIAPRQGRGYIIPRGKVYARISSPLSKTDPAVIAFTITVLQPQKDGVAKLEIFDSSEEN